MKKDHKLSIFIILLIVIFAVYWVNFRQGTKNTTPISVTKMTQVNNKQVTEKPSADGTVKLTETTQKLDDGNNSFSFTVTTKKTGETKTIFEATENQNTSYMIPDNAWSPDNKQFFMVKVTPTDQVYMVFKADGSSYANGDKFLDVGNFWTKAKYALKIKTLTGWASEDLIVVYTLKEDGTDGPHYWFVTSSRSFMLLSS